LRRRADYLAVQEGGRRHAGKYFLLLARARPAPAAASPGAARAARLGITVSRKVGGAVERNRVKRWVRESYRRLRFLAPPGLDLVVIARPGAPGIGLPATRAELEALLRRLARR
jgi:ribonuclease P protein component